MYIGAIISITVACSSALYIPDQNNIVPGSNMLDLQAGRKLYISKCGSCHTLFLPEKYSTDQWPFWLDDMEQKSNLKLQEKKLILNYLTKGLK